jgi:hypothetical protein
MATGELGAFGHFDAQLFGKIAYFVPPSDFAILRLVCKSFKLWLETYAQHRCEILKLDISRMGASKNSNLDKMKHIVIAHKEICELAHAGYPDAHEYRLCWLQPLHNIP